MFIDLMFMPHPPLQMSADIFSMCMMVFLVKIILDKVWAFKLRG